MTAKLSNRAARRLRLAGALLQSKTGWNAKILVDKSAGENYPSAVLRTVAALPPADQTKLRDLVDWVEDYELEEFKSGK